MRCTYTPCARTHLAQWLDAHTLEPHRTPREQTSNFYQTTTLRAWVSQMGMKHQVSTGAVPGTPREAGRVRHWGPGGILLTVSYRDY